jgi:complement component 1 Q subcomponent-binding protein
MRDCSWTNRPLSQFDHLDTNVQEEFERYLDERGIGGDLALFVPEYAEYKEQKVSPGLPADRVTFHGQPQLR